MLSPKIGELNEPMLKRFLRARSPRSAFAAAGAAPAAARAPQSRTRRCGRSPTPTRPIYLFGTIHLLPENYQWRTAKFDQAVDGSQQLVVETIVDDKNPPRSCRR